MSQRSESSLPLASRRDFMKRSGAAVLAGGMASSLLVPRSVHAEGEDASVLKVGLIGCGGRGTGAAANALAADSHARLWAMGDAFGDQIESSLANIRKAAEPQVDVAEERKFVGFDAFQHVIDSGVDVVLLATPPHFRPQQLAAAVAAGKHVFCEKPVAVDGPGVRSVLATCAEAKQKNLSIVSGLCWRYDLGMRETFNRVHEGDIGDIIAMQVNYNVGGLWMRPRQENWTDMEWQLRNWLYFTWLSGDHNVEQHIHSLDKAAWAMHDEPPVRCVGLGGRQVRTSPEYGHIFDHHAVVYDYANGTKLFSFCRQQDGCANDVSDHLLGTKGRCDVMKHRITGENEWRYRGEKPSMYQVEHNELFASIRSGEPINDGTWMTYSTLLAIMGRMATYTGQEVTWEQALNSQEDLTPPAYDWNLSLPVTEVALPGKTAFI